MPRERQVPTLFTALLLAFPATCAQADVSLPAIFSDHMVLQRDAPCPVWGKASPGEEVTVSFSGQEKSVTADNDGRWRVVLDAMPAPGGGEMTVAGENTVTLSDVAVGEVWICSGQSNMQWSIDRSFNAELNILSGNQPAIRLISIHEIGTQTPQEDFQGAWEQATPAAVAQFSAVGYLFGKRLEETLGVPIGLIDNAWGGSACEAWVPRDRLSSVEATAPIVEDWEQRESPEAEQRELDMFEEQLEGWRKRVDKALAAGLRAPEPPYPGRKMLMIGRRRPANLFNARIAPIAGYAIRGVIWYQGESNADRAQQYRDLFPLMIESWRDAWGQGDFSYYWVQLADFMSEVNHPQESEWAELREAQTMTLDRLPNTGQAVIIDIGNGVSIHPRNKQEVANRLARHALAKDYGMDIACESPRVDSVEFRGNRAIVKFANTDQLLRVDHDVVVGFALAGEDRQWHFATGKMTSHDTVDVKCDQVPNPVAIRYAWGDNPVCNLYSSQGLPVTPFRSDDWPGLTDGKR